jgi:hypothetical protein
MTAQTIFSNTQNSQKSKINGFCKKGIDFGNELERRLSYDPFPHPYRRITKFEAYYQMRFKEWCADYRIKDMRICVFRFYSGFSAEKQAALDLGNIHKQFALAFKT